MTVETQATPLRRGSSLTVPADSPRLISQRLSQPILRRCQSHEPTRCFVPETSSDEEKEADSQNEVPSFSLSTTDTEIRSCGSPDDESHFLADSFLAQFQTLEVTSSSGDDDELSRSLDNISLSSQSNIDIEEDIIQNRNDQPLTQSVETQSQRFALSSSAHSDGFLARLNMHLVRENEIKEARYNKLLPFTADAERAHERLQRKPRNFEQLKLTSPGSRRKKKLAEKQTETSFFGLFFKKMVTWSAVDDITLDSAADADKQSRSHALSVDEMCSDCIVEEKIVLPQSPVSPPALGTCKKCGSRTNLHEFDTYDDHGPELGLQRHSVTRLDKYDKSLRKRAQSTLLQGKRNIAFIDKVQVIEIHNRKMVPKEIRERMFYTRLQFVKMIANNMKEIELEVRKKQKLKRKKQGATKSM